MAIVLHKSEYDKPIGFLGNSSKKVTLREWHDKPEIRQRVVSLPELHDIKKQKELTIVRLESLDPDFKVRVIPDKTYTKDQVIQEVRNETPAGLRFIQVEAFWIERITQKLANGEYLLKD